MHNRTKLVFAYAKYIVEKELPANFSIHAGGVLITEKPIYAYTATDLPQKGYPVSHFEMQVRTKGAIITAEIRFNSSYRVSLIDVHWRIAWFQLSKARLIEVKICRANN